MANLSIRKLDDDIYIKLKMRAEKHRTSMEEEARQIISRAVCVSEEICEVFHKYFGTQNGVDLQLPSREPHEPMDFSE